MADANRPFVRRLIETDDTVRRVQVGDVTAAATDRVKDTTVAQRVYGLAQTRMKPVGQPLRVQ